MTSFHVAQSFERFAPLIGEINRLRSIGDDFLRDARRTCGELLWPVDSGHRVTIQIFRRSGVENPEQRGGHIDNGEILALRVMPNVRAGGNQDSFGAMESRKTVARRTKDAGDLRTATGHESRFLFNEHE